MAGMISMGPNKGLFILQEHGLSSTGFRGRAFERGQSKLHTNLDQIFKEKHLFNNLKNPITNLINRNK